MNAKNKYFENIFQNFFNKPIFDRILLRNFNYWNIFYKLFLIKVTAKSTKLPTCKQKIKILKIFSKIFFKILFINSTLQMNVYVSILIIFILMKLLRIVISYSVISGISLTLNSFAQKVKVKVNPQMKPF